MAFFILYFFTQIEKLAELLLVGGTLFKWMIIIWVVTYVISLFASRDAEHLGALFGRTKTVRKWSVIFAVIGAMMFTASHLTPTKRDLAIIVGGGVTYNVLTSDDAKEIGGKSLELLKKQLDEALSDGEVVETVKAIAKKEVKNAADKLAQ